jgi:hypothetical protein
MQEIAERDRRKSGENATNQRVVGSNPAGLLENVEWSGT